MIRSANTKTINLKAYAKLNLSLNLLPERGNNGFFKVYFINTQVSLYDIITLKTLPINEIKINEDKIKKNDNIAFKAAKLIYKIYKIKNGIYIDILKNIPIKAGLGGGSSDAAAVINGLDMLHNLNIGKDEKIKLAKRLGMDVCYCIIGGLCNIKGIGDTIESIPYKIPELNILLAIPHLKKSSTGWAYSIINENQIGKKIKMFYKLIDGIKTQNLAKIVCNLHNDFEEPINHYYPFTKLLRKCMIENGALNAMLAGSGLSVFGVFKDKKQIHRAKESLEDTFKGQIDCYIANTLV